MGVLKLSDNLIRLRKKKGITQEQLSEFIGVTKASVSKWETGNAMPDILLLPELAAYYDVSVDELIGYEPQLCKEQIRTTYLKLTAAFAIEPFDQAMDKVRDMVHRYYSCYPLLLQMSILFLNHFPLAGAPDKSAEILREGEELCAHIEDNCTDTTICQDAISVRALFNLQMGRVDQVIDALEKMADPGRLSSLNDTVLVQAYELSGQKSKALDHGQISIYMTLLALLGSSTQYLGINSDDEGRGQETIDRVDVVAQAYDIKNLHPNVMAQFDYQAALFLTKWGRTEEAIDRLRDYASLVLYLATENHCKLHGDEYFNRIDSVIGEQVLGAEPPRDRAFIRQSALLALDHPGFATLENNQKFKAVKLLLKEGE